MGIVFTVGLRLPGLVGRLLLGLLACGLDYCVDLLRRLLVVLLLVQRVLLWVWVLICDFARLAVKVIACLDLALWFPYVIAWLCWLFSAIVV